MNHSRSVRFAPWFLALPAIALLLAFALGPLLLLIRVSLLESSAGEGFYRPGTWSARSYFDLVGERFGRRLVIFGVALGVGVAALTLLIAYPLALVLQALPRRVRIVALGIVLLPKLANVYVVLYGLNLLLGRAGPVNRLLLAVGGEPVLLTHNLVGVVLGETLLVLPYAILILVLAIDRIDPALSAAARGLGAGPWRTFARVTFPLSLPGVILAGQLSLIWALGAFLGPLMLGGPDQATLGVMVQKWAQEDSNWPRAAAAAMLSLVMVGVCVALYALPARLLLGEGRRHA